MSVRAKHVFFGVFALLTLFVFYVYETPFLDPASPVWAHVEPVKWLLLPHAVAGAVALLLAPFQFSTTEPATCISQSFLRVCSGPWALTRTRRVGWMFSLVAIIRRRRSSTLKETC